MDYIAGIDIGSTYSKAIVLTDELEVVATAVRRTGFKLGQVADAVFEELLRNANLERSQIQYVTATGYGRYTVPYRHAQVTELTCHAQAVHHLFPQVRTMLDIGGQDIKAVRIDERGIVRAFRLNDKCAAGTGAFLEKTARYLGLNTDDIATVAMQSTTPVEVSSVCAVFAESEVINLLASGTPGEDILNGAIVALAGRSVQLMRRVAMEPEFALAGGMTRNPAMVAALEMHLKAPLQVAPNGLGQLNGAYGAALLGAWRLKKLRESGIAIPPPAGKEGEGAAAAGIRRWAARPTKWAATAAGSSGAAFKRKPTAEPAALAAAV